MATIKCTDCGKERDGHYTKGKATRCWKCHCMRRNLYKDSDVKAFATARDQTMKKMISRDWTKPGFLL